MQHDSSNAAHSQQDRDRSQSSAIPALARAWRLRIVTLDNPQVTREGLSHLSGLSQREGLSLGGTHVANEGLLYLCSLAKLNRLNLGKTGIAEKN